MQHHRSQRDIIETNFHAEADLLQSSLLVIPIARQITPYVYKLLRFNTRMKPIHLENVRRSALETSNTNKLVNNWQMLCLKMANDGSYNGQISRFRDQIAKCVQSPPHSSYKNHRVESSVQSSRTFQWSNDRNAATDNLKITLFNFPIHFSLPFPSLDELEVLKQDNDAEKTWQHSDWLEVQTREK